MCLPRILKVDELSTSNNKGPSPGKPPFLGNFKGFSVIFQKILGLSKNRKKPSEA